MPNPPERSLFFLLLFTILWSAAMGIEANGLAPAEKLPAGCYFSAKPILDIELAQRSDCFVAVATDGASDSVPEKAAARSVLNLKLFRLNTWMDFLFILLYWRSLVLFARIKQGQLTKWVITLASLSALFDVLENVQILKGLRAVANSSVMGLLPRPFSVAKWALLGVVLVLVGILVWLHKSNSNKYFNRLLAGAFLVSGVLTIVGITKPHVMIAAAFGFGISFLLILVVSFPYPADAILLSIEYSYLLRFQIVAAILFAFGLPLAFHFVPSLFVGLFDARGFTSFVFIVMAAFQLAWTIMVTSRLVIVYGPKRFVRATSIDPKPIGTGTVVLFGLLALPIVVILFRGTDRASVDLSQQILAATLGLVLALLILALTASLHFSIEDPDDSARLIFPSFGFLKKREGTSSRFWRFVALCLDEILPDKLKPGFLDAGVSDSDQHPGDQSFEQAVQPNPSRPPRLRSGHEMAVIALAVFLLFYSFLGLIFSPAWWNPDREPAALFFLLVLISLLTWFMSGAAFFLDAIRLPVFTTLLAVSLLTGVLGTDHKFVLSEKNAADEAIGPASVIDKWKHTRGKDSKTVLVVATAGGGIRAAAWTAEVMTRLEQGGCQAVTDSLVLISSVSGGSVGSMFVVAPYRGEGNYPSTDDDLSAVRYNAKRSSLSAVGWGLAYPDLARTIPVLGGFVPETFDRGWSLENTWSTGWREHKLATPTLKEWREDTRNGRRPAVIFNATASESGERFLVASTGGNFRGAVTFFGLFPQYDISVPTAARLSATFPYASPLARASAGSMEKAYHVGDGGYYDNSGLLSAVEWLDEARPQLDGYKVLLILIDALPGNTKPGSSWSWQRQLVGPIETLVHVRTSSQQMRESIELEMAKKYLTRQDGFRDSVPPTAGPAFEVIAEPFLFWTPNDPDPPLSWHLTPGQEAEISGAWAKKENRESWRNVRGTLHCTTELATLDQVQKEK
jgi:hypothetical protein